MSNQVLRLDPLVRRAVTSQAHGQLQLRSAEEAAHLSRCRTCYGTGIVPRNLAGSRLSFGPCTDCRSSDLYVMICQTGEGEWLAVRDIPGAWGRGGSPVEALLAVERRVDPAQSLFCPRFALPTTEEETGTGTTLETAESRPANHTTA
ncbi:MAG: hypothetical protein WDA75_11645 [Candidatus Latescibacterota bacterium]|jgi:hypothetical protein